METLFVGNLPYDTTDKELGQWLKSSGVNVDSVSLQFDRLSGRLRGFAYVVVPTGHAKGAIRRCNGRSFGGRTVVVAQPPQSSNGHSEEITELSSRF